MSMTPAGKSLFVAVVSGSLALLVVRPLWGQPASRIEIQSANYRVALKRAEAVESGSKKFHFEILGTTNKPASFVLSNLTTQVRKLDIYQDKLVVYGSVESKASGLTVVDLQRGEELDFMLGYHPQRSSTGRYVIYRKFYPRFSPPEVQSDLVLIYDLARSPNENRLGGESSPVGLRVGSPEHLLASERVGYPIYPLANVRDRSYQVWVEKPAQRHLVVGGFLWGQQDERVLFVDRQEGKDSVVVVDLSGGLERPKVAKLPLEEASFQSVVPPGSSTFAEEDEEGDGMDR